MRSIDNKCYEEKLRIKRSSGRMTLARELKKVNE